MSVQWEVLLMCSHGHFYWYALLARGVAAQFPCPECSQKEAFHDVRFLRAELAFAGYPLERMAAANEAMAQAVGAKTHHLVEVPKEVEP